MSYLPESEYQHGSASHVGVLLINLGTPDAPTPKDVRRYLAEFLMDKRVVEIPRALWWLILHGIILRIRPARSAVKYASIWTTQGSPLRTNTDKQVSGLRSRLRASASQVQVEAAMRYGQPSISKAWANLKAKGCDRILLLPLYPQYAASTTASAFDEVARLMLHTRNQPALRSVKHYHDDPRYIQALAQHIKAYWQTHGRAEKLIMSFHGLPQRSLMLGDPYHCECHKTGRLLAEALGLSKDEYLVTFQSRFGKAKWLQPYTEPTVQHLAKRGVASLQVVCPGFVSDCLETLEEIAQEVKHAFLTAGGRDFQYIPCLNDDPVWLDALAAICLQHLQGWDLLGPDAAELARSAERAHALKV